MSLAIFFTVLCFKTRTFQNILSCLGLPEEHLYKHRPFPLNANRLITSSVGLRHLNFSRTVFWILLFKSHRLLDFNPFQWYQIDWRTQTPVGRASHVPMLYPGEGPTETKFMSRPTHSCEKSQAIYTALKNTKGLDSPKVNSPGEVGQILVKKKKRCLQHLSHAAQLHICSQHYHRAFLILLSHIFSFRQEISEQIKPTGPVIITMPHSHVPLNFNCLN